MELLSGEGERNHFECALFPFYPLGALLFIQFGGAAFENANDVYSVILLAFFGLQLAGLFLLAAMW